MGTTLHAWTTVDDESRLTVEPVAAHNHAVLGAVAVRFDNGHDVYLTAKAAARLVDALVEQLVDVDDVDYSQPVGEVADIPGGVL